MEVEGQYTPKASSHLNTEALTLQVIASKNSNSIYYFFIFHVFYRSPAQILVYLRDSINWHSELIY